MTTVRELDRRLIEVEQAAAAVREQVTELTVGHDVQAEILTAIQAELIESERLTGTITRLAEGSDALVAALLKVDETAQATTRLGKELAQVKEEGSTTEEIEAKVQEAKELAEKKIEEAKIEADRELRRARRQRNFIVVAVVLLALAVGVGGYRLREQQQRQEYLDCIRSAQTAAGVTTFLAAVAENSIVPEIKSTASDLLVRFEDRPDCEKP